MDRVAYVAVGVVLGALAVPAAGRVAIQDPVKLSPQYYTVRFENDRVRVLEFHMKPGGKEPMHSHPPGVVYWLADATIRNVFPDGTSAETAVKAGEVQWRETTIHTGENLGATEARAVAIEMKRCAQ